MHVRHILSDKMVKYPSREKIRHNIDMTIHGLCSHISKDLHVFIKKQILKKMDDLKGLSLREIDVLMCVAYFNGPVTSSDVAETIRFDPATVTRATSHLIENGYLAKEDNYEDARSVLLCLTDKGDALARRFSEKAGQALSAAEQKLTMVLTDDEREEFLRLLLKMRERSMQFSKIKKLPILQEPDLRIVRTG